MGARPRACPTLAASPQVPMRQQPRTEADRTPRRVRPRPLRQTPGHAGCPGGNEALRQHSSRIVRDRATATLAPRRHRGFRSNRLERDAPRAPRPPGQSAAPDPAPPQPQVPSAHAPSPQPAGSTRCTVPGSRNVPTALPRRTASATPTGSTQRPNAGRAPRAKLLLAQDARR